jgi:hypothetical protein
VQGVVHVQISRTTESPKAGSIEARVVGTAHPSMLEEAIQKTGLNLQTEQIPSEIALNMQGEYFLPSFHLSTILAINNEHY